MESYNTKIDSTEFEVTVGALLSALGADRYADIFRKRNIGQVTLCELSDEDLIRLGVDNWTIRRRILKEVQSLPVYVERSKRPTSGGTFGPIEMIDLLEESSKHLYRIYLSILSNSLALKKTKNVTDSLLFEDKYASDIALATMSEITNILNSMDIAVHTQLKGLLQEPNTTKKKKIIVGTVGTAVIAVIAVLFVKSLKQL